jgi:hypothetical protein
LVETAAGVAPLGVADDAVADGRGAAWTVGDGATSLGAPPVFGASWVRGGSEFAVADSTGRGGVAETGAAADAASGARPPEANFQAPTPATAASASATGTTTFIGARPPCPESFVLATPVMVLPTLALLWAMTGSTPPYEVTAARTPEASSNFGAAVPRVSGERGTNIASVTELPLGSSARIAAIMSAVDAYRWAGSSASALCTIPATAVGVQGASSCTCRGGVEQICRMSSPSVSTWPWGVVPERAS